jgi:hypothetical protein
MVKLHLDIPFYPNQATPQHPDGLYCQEMSLKMILGYFLPNKTFSTKQLEEITGMKPEKAAWEMPFSIWLIDHGFEVKHYAPFDYQAFKNEGMDYIRRTYGDDVADWQIENSDIETALELIDEYISKVKIIKSKPTLGNIMKQMEQGYLVRAQVDSGLLNGTGKYVGHSVVVTGYDNDSIWFHDPGLPATKNRKASRTDFQKAMAAFGYEIDAIKKV